MSFYNTNIYIEDGSALTGIYNQLLRKVTSVTEVPVLSAHRTLLGHLLSCQPLEDAVHMETMFALSGHCRND